MAKHSVIDPEAQAGLRAMLAEQMQKQKVQPTHHRTDVVREPGETDMCDTPLWILVACFAGCLNTYNDSILFRWGVMCFGLTHLPGGTAREVAEIGEGTSGDWNRC